MSPATVSMSPFVSSTPVPLSTGTPASIAAWRARDLSPDRVRVRPDPDDAGRQHLSCELRVLGEEPVAGMDRVGANARRRLQDLRG